MQYLSTETIKREEEIQSSILRGGDINAYLRRVKKVLNSQTYNLGYSVLNNDINLFPPNRKAYIIP